MFIVLLLIFFFFYATATTVIYTLSLHDALPICSTSGRWSPAPSARTSRPSHPAGPGRWGLEVRAERSEEHTSELQSLRHLVCRLLLEKKKKNKKKKYKEIHTQKQNQTTKKHNKR